MKGHNLQGRPRKDVGGGGGRGKTLEALRKLCVRNETTQKKGKKNKSGLIYLVVGPFLL